MIQTRKNQINESVGNLRENLNEIYNNPVKVEDSEFDGKVQEVKSVVSDLHSKAAQKLGKFFQIKKHLHFSDLDDKDTKMIGQVNEVKTHVSDARKNIKDIDSKMGQIDDKVAFVKLELDRLKSDEGSHF